jgi:hypothetical protein
MCRIMCMIMRIMSPRYSVYFSGASVTNKKSFITSTTGLEMSTWKTQGQLKNIDTKVITNLYALPSPGMEQLVFNYIFIDYRGPH